MNYRALCLLAAASAAMPATAQPAPAQPTGPWVVAYEDGVCLLQREFGSKDRPLTLSLRQVPTTSRVRLFLLDSGHGRAPDRARIGFGDTDTPIEAPLLSYRTRDGRERYHETEVSRADIERAASGMLSFEAGAFHSRLALTGLKKALAQVDACLADQLARWGMNPAQQATIARFPRPKEEILNDGDFILEDALAKGSGGQNIAYVEVDAKGNARGCKVARSSGNPILDQASCDLLMGAEFRPATDRSSQPMAGLFAHSFRWRVAE